MLKLIVAAAGAAIVMSVLAPPAWAQPDPHVPDGAANWCPGGKHPGYGGQKQCLGAPFADGTFYSQTWSFGPGGPWNPGHWFDSAGCSTWIENSIQGMTGPGACGGGPQWLQIR